MHKINLFTSRLISDGNAFIFTLVYANSVEFCQTSCAVYFMFRAVMFHVNCQFILLFFIVEG